MTYQELLDLAKELQTNHSARWVKCVRNHLSLLCVRGEAGQFDFIPIKYLAHVIGEGDPDATKIPEKPSELSKITEVLGRVDFTQVRISDPIFDRILEEYLDHYRMLPGDVPDDYERKRRGYAQKGSLNFWVPNASAGGRVCSESP